LEETAKSEKDWEEVVPFNLGVKRGEVESPAAPAAIYVWK